MGNNLGWKTVNKNHDKRNPKQLGRGKYTGITGRICSICGKPIHGGGNMCGSCEKFIKRKKSEERQA